MTPIQDHAHHLRQRLIKDRRSAAQMHYQALIAKGLREDDAANMAGWHPMMEVDTWLGRATVSIVIAVVTFLLIILTTNANAMVDMRLDMRDLKDTEAAFTRCLNGEPIRMEDRWFKCDCVVMANGGKCPEATK